MTTDLNIYQKAIELLVSEGYSVLQIVNADGSAFYFITYEFQESYFNNTQSVDYCIVKGINITEFLKINIANPQRVNFMSNFNRTLQEMPMIRCEFSKDTRWLKWSPAV